MEWRTCILRSILRFLRRGPEQSGNVAVVFALSLPIVAGGAALGVETSYWYYNSLRLQAVADAAAYAGALEQVSGSDTPTIVAAATTSAALNNFDTSTGTINVNTPPSSGPNAGNKAVEVITNRKSSSSTNAVAIATIAFARRSSISGDLRAVRCLALVQSTGAGAWPTTGSTIPPRVFH